MGDESDVCGKWRNGAGPSFGGTERGGTICARLDGHAYAGDGRVQPHRTYPARFRIVPNRYHDAYFGRPSRRRRAMSEAGRVGILVEANTAGRIAGSHFALARSPGKANRNSV